MFDGMPSLFAVSVCRFEEKKHSFPDLENRMDLVILDLKWSIFLLYPDLDLLAR